ncbi:SH3 domain-containing protein [Paracidovorax avenae]|uniref:SH3 domain-containing protein n=1 Tax=Paracidovorax avenae TaxID=80867 RepID=UPI000D20C2E3|nr:SH3 domain-containing protein [Paracidovorax avenae]AVT01641.1 hypothetical protein C8243_03405 [Paracidovorax avenae]
MIRSTDYLSTVDQFNSLTAARQALGLHDSLATARQALGLHDSVASAMRQINEMNAFGGIAALRQQAEGSFGARDHMLQEARKIAGLISESEQVRKLHSSLFGDAVSEVERYRRMVSDAVGPLSAWRSAALYESEATRLAKEATGLAGSFGIRSFVDIYSATEQIRKQQEMLATSFGEPLANRWMSSTREIAEQFSSARDIIERQTRAFGGGSLFDAAQLARSFGMPVMDHGSFAAIARSSGIDGVMAQFRSLGIDQETLRRVAAAVADDEEEVDEILGDAAGEDTRASRQLTKAQLARLWNLFYMLLGLVMPFYSLWDSNQMEARLNAEIKASEARTAAEIKTSEERAAAKLDAMAKLMEKVLEVAAQEVLAEESMVVRERMAVIRSKPEHGSSVIAEAFPNQVVTLREERGKWIKVEYYDWIAREERTGWALKKYFVRAEPTDARPSKRWQTPRD